MVANDSLSTIVIGLLLIFPLYVMEASWRRFHLDTGKFVTDTGDKFFAGMYSIGNRLSLVPSTFVKGIKSFD